MAQHTGKRAASASADPELEMNTLKLCPLGAGAEVGRSCLILRFKGKTIMLDCGILPSFQGEEALPLLREIDPAEVDIVIITHFHIDHCAALPHFTERMTGFRGRIFATHPTIAVMRMVLQDFVRVSKIGADNDGSLYTQDDVDRCLARMEPLDLRQRANIGGVQLTFYHAGHVLGACMASIEIAGVSVLYTGDYSCEEDRHLMAAQAPPGLRPDLLVVEATYGMQVHESREQRERRFLEAVEKVVRRGGRCLIPMFALGRAQELMLILEEHWASHPELRAIPIYHASRMAESSLDVYRTFVSHMNARVQAAVGERNPWAFQYIKSIQRHDFRDNKPCVMMASPGMLQQGFSRELFDRWCEDPKNGVVLAGYSVEGTLARQLEANPIEVESSSRRKLIRRCLVERVSFSAHADSVQTARFVDAVRPCAIVLVHGERSEMARLHSALARRYDGSPGFRGVRMPGNNVTFTMAFKEQKLARVVGLLAEKALARTLATGRAGIAVSGLLVTRNFEHLLLTPAELPQFTQLATHSVAQKLHVPYRSSFGMLRAFVRAMYADTAEVLSDTHDRQSNSVDTGADDSKRHRHLMQRTLSVSGLVTLTHSPPDRIILTWRASPQADLVADSLVAVISQAEVSQASIKATSRPCCHSHDSGARGGSTLPLLASMPGMQEEQTHVIEDASAGAADDIGQDVAHVACLVDIPWACSLLSSDSGPFSAPNVPAELLQASNAGPVPPEFLAQEHTHTVAGAENDMPITTRRRRNLLLQVLAEQYGKAAVRYVPSTDVGAWSISVHLGAKEAVLMGSATSGDSAEGLSHSILSVVSEDDDLRASVARAVELTSIILQPVDYSAALV